MKFISSTIIKQLQLQLLIQLERTVNFWGPLVRSHFSMTALTPVQYAGELHRLSANGSGSTNLLFPRNGTPQAGEDAQPRARRETLGTARRRRSTLDAESSCTGSSTRRSGRSAVTTKSEGEVHRIGRGDKSVAAVRAEVDALGTTIREGEHGHGAWLPPLLLP